MNPWPLQMPNGKEAVVSRRLQPASIAGARDKGVYPYRHSFPIPAPLTGRALLVVLSNYDDRLGN